MEDNIFLMVKTALSQMGEMGFAQNTIKLYEHSVFAPIIQEYEKYGDIHYSQEIMDRLAIYYEHQLKEGLITRAIYNWRKRGIRVLDCIHKCGQFDWKDCQNKQESNVPAPFSDLAEEFNSSLNLSDSSREKVTYMVHRFLAYLFDHDVVGLHEIQPDNVRQFLSAEYERSPHNMDSVIYSMRKFFLFLSTKGIDIHKNWLFLSSPMRTKKVLPTFASDELARIISNIDTTISPGKRDLAIVLLALTTGLRAGDIIALKLTDIKWVEREICLIQRKTGCTLSLPLQESVLTVLADYILNERPKSNLPNVFLTCRAPYRVFAKGGELSGILHKYMRCAGIQHEAGDGKSFHGLRRFLGTNIVSGGAPVTMAAQVLGHQGIAATRQYIAADLNGLRKCVLPMRSLEVGHEKGCGISK